MAKQSEATLLLKIKQSGENLLSKTGDALKKLGQVAVTAYAAANAAAAASIAAYHEQEQATNALNQALINQGIYTKELSQGYQKIASDLQRVSTYGDEAIVAAQAQIQQYIGQEKVTKELTKATLDFATAMGMDLNSAASTIGKSIGSNTNLLSRYGIEVDVGASKSEKLAQVVQQLQGKFGGQAQAAADGLGALTQMKNAMGDILEVAGQKLAPVITYAAKSITDFAFELQENEILLHNFQTAAIALGKAGIYLKNIIVGIGEAIGQVFGTIAGAALQVANGQFKMAYETIKSGFSGTAKTVKDRYGTLNKELAAIDSIYANKKEADNKEELRKIEQTARAREDIATRLTMTLQDQFSARSQDEIQRLMDQERLKEDQHLRSLNLQIQREENQTRKLQLEKQKRDYLDNYYEDLERKRIFNLADFKNQMNSKSMREFEGVLGNMAQMQNSKSAVLVGIGKAAAMAQMAISTARGAVEAYSFGASIGGPAAGILMAAPIVTYGTLRTAEISGIQLAEGGIVKATPGGVPAIIGEGGRDEMVIPIEKGNEPGMGTKITLEVYGGFLGNESQAKEFAMVLDRELLKLRQSNESLAFDKGIV